MGLTVGEKIDSRQGRKTRQTSVQSEIEATELRKGALNCGEVDSVEQVAAHIHLLNPSNYKRRDGRQPRAATIDYPRPLEAFASADAAEGRRSEEKEKENNRGHFEDEIETKTNE